MRAMIMSAGVGTRLRPVTDLLPKPMVPIVNRPALYHILRLLHRHGLREVVINLHYLPEVIRDYRDLLGTAGGVKKNADFLGQGTFLVMSGDALTDVDLTGLVAQHRRNGSVATMAVKEVADPSQYGVVVADDDGRVVGFQEKPTIEAARSRLCNCGIYVFEPEILSHIPEGQFDDFGKRLFPDLLKQGVPFHAHAVNGYWSDVGNLREYMRSNADALAGRVSVELPGVEVRPGVWVEDDLTLPESLYIEPPIAIGRNCQIGEGVILEGPAVIGDGCVIASGAHVARALLLPGSRVPAGGLIVDGVVGQKTAGQA
jgi:mannose-1-phosphate guanylyltransferase